MIQVSVFGQTGSGLGSSGFELRSRVLCPGRVASGAGEAAQVWFHYKYWNKSKFTSFKFVSCVVSCRAKRTWPGRAKQVMTCPPDGLPARPKHGTGRASGRPEPMPCSCRAKSLRSYAGPFSACQICSYSPWIMLRWCQGFTWVFIC
jgi:hypothetical protein